MEKSEASMLCQRWQSIPDLDLRAALQEGKSPFGLCYELADFRGATINQSIHQASFENTDLSFSTMERGQLAAAVKRSCFAGVRYESNIGKHFEHCDFTSANLSNSMLRGAFISCNFSNSNLASTRSTQAKFTDCIFESAKLAKASFYDCEFERCRFSNCRLISGSLAGSTFRDCSTEGLKIEKTILERVKGLA